eukprot:Clim_evm55s243 gene=Clim_evmTU55s243
MKTSFLSFLVSGLLALAVEVNALRVFTDQRCLHIKGKTWFWYDNRECRYSHEPNSEMQIWQASFAGMPLDILAMGDDGSCISNPDYPKSDVLSIQTFSDADWVVFEDEHWRHGKYSCILIDATWTLSDEEYNYTLKYAQRYGAPVFVLGAQRGTDSGNQWENGGVSRGASFSSGAAYNGVPTQEGMAECKNTMLSANAQINLAGVYGEYVHVTGAGNTPFFTDRDDPSKVFAYYHNNGGADILISYLSAPLWTEAGSAYATYLMDWVFRGNYFGRRDYSRYLETMNTEVLANVWPQPLGLWFGNGKYGGLSVPKILAWFDNPPMNCGDDSLAKRADRRNMHTVTVPPHQQVNYNDQDAQLIFHMPCQGCEADNMIFYSSRTDEYPITASKDMIDQVVKRFPNIQRITKCGSEWTAWVTATHLEKGETYNNPPKEVPVTTVA